MVERIIVDGNPNGFPDPLEYLPMCRDLGLEDGLLLNGNLDELTARLH